MYIRKEESSPLEKKTREIKGLGLPSTLSRGRGNGMRRPHGTTKPLQGLAHYRQMASGCSVIESLNRQRAAQTDIKTRLMCSGSDALPIAF